MQHPGSGRLAGVRSRALAAVSGPQALAFVPAAALGAYWLGGEPALLATALGLPLAFAAAGGFGRAARPAAAHDSITGLMLRDGFEQRAAEVFAATEDSGLRSAVFLVELDEYKELARRHGQEAADKTVQRCGDRIAAILRSGDTVARMGDSRFAVCLSPVPQLDLELCIQLAGRIQAALEEPVALDGTAIHLSCSVGFCMRNRCPGPAAADWTGAAGAALAEAQNLGPSGIRAYSAEIYHRIKARGNLREEAAEALEDGQIQAWFQPQINTDTGRVSGFEALARWVHPVQGILSPQVFLPAIEEAGLMDRLSQVMIYQSLAAVKAWDAAGAGVPSVGVNFTCSDLRNPALADRLKWELERFGLEPARLSVEVLETVMTDHPDDAVARNIKALGKMGCRIDLDDFGTGNASIAAVRRFRISRIKIDRSFVLRADRDPEQQRLISAILTMAERLDLDTLAEGVETAGEHALLAQLGCGHVQGYGIARPMPFDQTLDWISAHQSKLQDTPAIGRQAH